MEQGWDPELKKYLQKILNTIGYGLLWILSGLTLGFYFGLAYQRNIIYVVLFHAALVTSLAFLIRYLYHTWKK